MKDFIKKLKTAGLLSDQDLDLGSVGTGSYALNKIISGSYSGGIPIGSITQFHGESSTAKTVFATYILREAQSKGYYTMLVDSENAFNSAFAQKLGIDPDNLIYSSPDTLEGCFQAIYDTIIEIRANDKDTPIVIAYDSLAVSPSKDEFEDKTFEGNNMVGAIRAKATGACLRKINPILRQNKVALVIINQIRSKVGVIYGNPDTIAAGGKSLEYYLGVNLKTISNKTSDLLKDDLGNVIGIKGTIRNTKNKVSIPFQECSFELLYNEGLSKYYGVLDLLCKDGIITRNGSWYAYKDKKFQEGSFNNLLSDEKDNSLNDIKKLLSGN